MRRVGLAEQVNKKTGKYSRGMRQRLGLADVLIKNPEIIILDEPTSGIDPAGIQEFIELIRNLSRVHSFTVLFSSHNLDQVQKACDRVGLFNHGELLAQLDLREMEGKQVELIDIYNNYIKEGVRSMNGIEQPFWVIVNKEIRDHVRSWRFIILLAIITLTCLGALYTSLTSMHEAVKSGDVEDTFSS